MSTASPLEQLVNSVRSLSANGSYAELYEWISKNQEVLLRNSMHLNNVLETLDVQQHSLGILAVLSAKYSLPRNSPGIDHNNLFDQIRDFIYGCSGEQIRFAPDLFSDLCHSFTNHVVEINQAIRGIETLKKAIRKIQMFDSQLTSVHADLYQLCLLSKCMKPAIEFLDVDVTGISSEQGGQNDSKHFLLCYYYGGMIYAAMKNFDRALYFFEVAITTPAVAVSHIMLEAYKKYILVSLILHGKIQPIPKYTCHTHVVTRFLKPLSSAYTELAEPHATGSIQLVIQKNREIYINDQNMGLVNQVLASMYKKSIQRLTKTFLTLSLSDVASRVQLASPQQAEKYILSMIYDGEIYAVINQKDGMVVFLDSPEKYASPETLCLLERQMANCTRLHQHILEMDKQIQVNPQYIKKCAGNQDDELLATTQSSKTTYSM